MLALEWLIVSDRFAPPPSVFGLSRNAAIAGGVIVFHAAALWALQSGLLRRAAEVVIPVEIMSQFVEPPKPTPPPPPPPPPPPQPRVKAPPPPRPQAIREPKPTPAPQAPVGDPEPPPPAPTPPSPPPAPPAPPAPPPAPPAPPKVVEVTAAQAQWLRPPAPVYPQLSSRLGEAGTVTIAVYFNRSGLVRRAEILKSSGYDRLDRAARDAVLKSSVTVSNYPNASDETLFMLPAPIVFNQPK
ncbi:outer membrane transport energization protein TonB [Variovorax sp. PDC80]|nr:outer membrane transport energization protein TonB [Variovorax sp. PDC80]